MSDRNERAPDLEEHDHPPRRRPRARRSDEAFERAAALFHAAANPWRLRVLDLLAEGEWCVTEIAEASGMPMSTLSSHLQRLHAERVVERRRAGKHIYYALADDHVRELVTAALDHASEERSVSHPEED